MQWSHVGYRALEKTVMNRRVPAKEVNFFLSRATFKFVRNTPRDHYGAFSVQLRNEHKTAERCTQNTEHRTVTVSAIQTKRNTTYEAVHIVQT